MAGPIVWATLPGPVLDRSIWVTQASGSTTLASGFRRKAPHLHACDLYKPARHCVYGFLREISAFRERLETTPVTHNRFERTLSMSSRGIKPPTVSQRLGCRAVSDQGGTTGGN